MRPASSGALGCFAVTFAIGAIYAFAGLSAALVATGFLILAVALTWKR